MKRRALVVAVTVIQVLFFGTLVTRHVRDWSRAGWSGLAFSSDREAGAEGLSAIPWLGGASREVAMVAPGAPASAAGVQQGDRLITINDVAVADVAGLQALSRELASGDRISYRLERGEETADLSVVLESPYRSPYMVVTTASTLLVGTAFLLISLLVYWSRPASQPALVFFFMCAVGAAEYFVWAISELSWPDMRGVMPTGMDPGVLVLLAVTVLLSVALVNLLLHLTLIFPKRRPVLDRWPEVLVWLYAAPLSGPVLLTALVSTSAVTRTVLGVLLFEIASAVLAVGLAMLLLGRIRAGGLRAAVRSSPITVLSLLVIGGCQLAPLARLLPGAARTVLAVFLGVSSVLSPLLLMLAYSMMACIALYRSYRESGVEVKRQVRWPLWGTLTALGGTVLVTLISVVISVVASQLGDALFAVAAMVNTAGKLLYLLIPVAFAFAILKYRLMDIDVLIRKTVIYSGVTGFVVVVYLLLAGVSGLALVRSAGVESQTATMLATLVVVAMFVPVRNRIQRFVDRRFFQRERDSEESLQRITGLVLQSLSLDALLPAVAEEVQQTLQCRTVAVFILSPGGDRLAAEATIGVPDTAAGRLAFAAASDLFAGHAKHIDLQVAELTADEQHTVRRVAAERGVVARRGDEVVGFLTVGRKLSREPFDDGDSDYLEAVATQLAVGLGRLRGRRAELEFAQALEIQRNLLPSAIPQIDGVEVSARWQPAREVSGDYYDVIRLDDRRLALCIGDVVGKGMPAALLMSSLQAAVKAVATPEAEPAAVCRQVRSVVAQNLSGGRFVTFFFAILDRGSQSIRYTNCGHNPPILLRSDGSQLHLADGGPAIARLLRDTDYRQAEVELEAGDRLVLFTDGVTEAADAAGEMYGDGRLEGLVRDNSGQSAAELEETVAAAVLRHAEGELQDDLTLVVAAVLSPD